MMSLQFSPVDDLADISRFFISTWEEGIPYAYRVYLPQKSLNLNEYFFMQEFSRLEEESPEDAERLKQLRYKTFISQSGILGKAPSLARSYILAKRFLPVLFVDELTMTGHEISEAVYALFEEVVTEIERLQGWELDSSQYQEIQNQFFRAVNCRVYMQDKRGLLLEGKLASRIRAENKVSTDSWFPFVQKATRFLTWEQSIRNTYFIPTFWVDKAEYDRICLPEDWDQVFVKGYLNTVRIRSRNLFSEKDLVSSHCALYCREDTGSGRVGITPYVFFGVPRESDFHDLFSFLSAACMTQAERLRFDHMLSGRSKRWRAMRLQVFFTLSSIDLFRRFLEACGGTIRYRWSSLESSDLEKIFMAYGTIEEIARIYFRIQKRSNLRNALSEKIYAALIHAAPLCQGAGQLNLQNVRFYKQKAEEFVLNAEDDLQDTQRRRRKHKILYTAWAEYYYPKNSLSSYLNWFSERHDSIALKFAALVSLLQEGFVRQIAAEGEKNTCYLTAGESSLALLFLQNEKYIPVLQQLEEWCRKNGFNTPRWAERFGEFLEESGFEEDLSLSFRHLVETVYDYGYYLKNWPFSDYAEGTRQDCDREMLYLLNEFLE